MADRAGDRGPDEHGSGERMARLPRAFVPDLNVAVRRARLEEVERSQTTAELRTREIARLEALRLALAPLFAQTGPHAGFFDHGLVAGDNPKLFIDMISYVDCGRDRKTYRFVQDTRNGPVTLSEGDRVDPIIDAVTLYVARRIVERERAQAVASPVEKKVIAAAAAAPADDGKFGEMFALFVAGAMTGAALLYAAIKLVR